MATQSDNTNGVLGGLPVAEQNQDYFLVFKGVGGTGPEIIDNTAYFIQYVVDSDGNVSKPSQGSIARLNAIQNFPQGKTTTVRIDNASGINTQLDGDHVITGLGIQQPILYTQYGTSSTSYTQSISFLPPKGIIGSVPNILGSMIKTNFFFNSSSTVTFTDYTSTPITPVSGANFNTSSGIYFITNSVINNIDEINIKVSYTVRNFGSDIRTVNIYLAKDTIYLATDTFEINPLAVTTRVLNIKYIPDYLGATDQIKIQANTSNTIKFDQLKLEIPSTNPMPVTQVNSFWSTGSHTNMTWLTASYNLSINYGNIQNTSNFQGTEGSFGLSPIKELFTPKSGDRIRFGYNSERDYVIYDVITPDEDDEGYLKLKLNKILPSNTILDNFVLHRVDNASIKYIILDIAKDPTVDNPANPFTGIILPKYPSEKLKNNLENILSKLKQEGIIEN